MQCVLRLGEPVNDKIEENKALLRIRNSTEQFTDRDLAEFCTELSRAQLLGRLN